MDIHSANDNSYIQYLIFYECLESQHYKAYNLYKDVLEEMDEHIDFDKKPQDKYANKSRALSEM